jgi:hypothetical protein
MSVINRPIPSQLDNEKVKNMKQVLQIPERENELTPIVSKNTKRKDLYDSRVIVILCRMYTMWYTKDRITILPLVVVIDGQQVEN